MCSKISALFFIYNIPHLNKIVHRLKIVERKLTILLLIMQILLILQCLCTIWYSDNYSDTSGSLWGFKRDEISNNANVINDDNAPSFKYKESGIGDTENNGTKTGVKIEYNTVGDDRVSDDSLKSNFLARVKIENYNIEIDGKMFYGHPINYSIKQYQQVKVMITLLVVCWILLILKKITD